jgi:hypothetical protein
LLLLHVLVLPPYIHVLLHVLVLLSYIHVLAGVKKVHVC